MLILLLIDSGITALAFATACSSGSAHGGDYTAAALGLDL
jgi:hypothetical protein